MTRYTFQPNLLGKVVFHLDPQFRYKSREGESVSQFVERLMGAGGYSRYGVAQDPTPYFQQEKSNFALATTLGYIGWLDQVAP